VTTAADRAVADLKAYAETLTASEALGEIRDLGTFYGLTAGISNLVGNPGSTLILTSLLTPVLLEFAARLDVEENPGGGGIVAAPPRGVDEIKARDLVSRALEAAARDAGIL
jgi:hypothetical protein